MRGANYKEKHMSQTEKALFKIEIARLRKKGVIEPVKGNEAVGFVSSIFLREKKNNKHRLILNLKPFNKNVVQRHFKMDTLKTAINLVKKNCFMASVDLSDAYYSVPIALTDQKYLLFQFEGTRYKFMCLPNGLCAAPRIFTKIMKPILSALRKKGHQLMNYLDDIFIVGETEEECRSAVLDTIELLQNLGFTIHPEKSQLIPSQEIEFLGFILNSKSFDVKLTSEKVNKIEKRILTLLKNKNSIRDIAQILGSFEAALPAIPYGRLHMFYLTKAKNEALKKSKGCYESDFCIYNDCVQELKWWTQNLKNSKSIRQPLPKNLIYSDACPNGWGAAFKQDSTGGHWSERESKIHINLLEMTAAIFALKIYAKQFFDTSIHLKVDNTATLAWINKQTGPNLPIFLLVKEFWEFCIRKRLWVQASYIKSKRNKIADKE